MRMGFPLKVFCMEMSSGQFVMMSMDLSDTVFIRSFRIFFVEVLLCTLRETWRRKNETM